MTETDQLLSVQAFRAFGAGDMDTAIDALDKLPLEGLDELIAILEESAAEKGVRRVKFDKGRWSYQGRIYDTMRAALEAAWPKGGRAHG